jgi:hypothetical protein
MEHSIPFLVEFPFDTIQKFIVVEHTSEDVEVGFDTAFSNKDVVFEIIRIMDA